MKGKITMIYAAYAGIGKSYLCQEHPERIDLCGFIN